MKKKVLIIIVAIIFIIVASNIFGNGWIIYNDGPYKGKVVDVNNSMPIEGVAVTGVWWLELYGGPGGPMPSYCDTQEAITNHKGEFVLPRAVCFHYWPLSKLETHEIVVFKPGYLSFPPRNFESSAFTGDEFKDKRQYQIIKLGKAKTREERISAKSLVDIYSENIIFIKAPYLLDLINKERKSLGFKGEIEPVYNGGQ